MSEELHFTVAINRFVDISITFFNSLVALMLLTGGWYKVTLDSVFNGCTLTRGTIIVPFASGICEFDTMTDLPGDQGKKWATMKNFVITYFAFSIIISSLVGYESVVYGIRKLNNANTISFGLNLVSLIIQSMILIEAGKIDKPEHVSSEIAVTLITAALAMSCVRVLVLGWFMYHQKKTNPIGIFGTGGHV